jgi:hypothetical protein
LLIFKPFIHKSILKNFQKKSSKTDLRI